MSLIVWAFCTSVDAASAVESVQMKRVQLIRATENKYATNINKDTMNK